MQHEFRFGDETVEVSLSKQNNRWILSDLEAEIMPDGRIKITNSENKTTFAHAAKVGDTWWVHIAGHTLCIDKIEPGASQLGDEGGMTAPMPGKILDVLVNVGESVEEGQLLMIMEAMKMEHRITASSSGVISSLNFSKGDQVNQGDVLIEVSD